MSDRKRRAFTAQTPIITAQAGALANANPISADGASGGSVRAVRAGALLPAQSAP